MTVALQSLPSRIPISRRSAFLILFGIAYALIGLSYVVGPPTDTQQKQLHWVLQYVPLSAFGTVWILCGLIAIVTGLTRWHKEYGFGALTGVGLFWGAMYGIAWKPLGDVPTGWRTLIIFWMISGAVHIVAGLVDPRR